MRVGTIIRGLNREKRLNKLSKRNRLISQKLYSKLKAKRKCSKCKKKCVPEIHHIKPVRKGGESTELNLINLCQQCHITADKANEE